MNSKEIYNHQNLINVESKIATVGEIFRLQNELEYENAEKKYKS